MNNKQGTLPVRDILPDAEQPRKFFDASKMHSLKESIKRHGIKEPLLVEEIGNGKYLLIDGERRFRAAQELKLKEVPVSIEKSQTEADRLVVQFNIQEQHEGWTPVEKAMALIKLSETMGMTLPAVCKMLGIENKTSNRYVAFAELADKDAYVRNEIPLDYAVPLRGLTMTCKNIYFNQIEREFTKIEAKKIQESFVRHVKDGTIVNATDVSKLKDAFTKNPKLIEEFMLRSDATPQEMFLKAKAAGAFHLRNMLQSSSYVISHAHGFMKHKDVKITDDQLMRLKSAQHALGQIIDLVE